MLNRFENRFEDKLPDWYWDLTTRMAIWRHDTLPWFYRWKSKRQHKRNMIEKFGFVPVVGDYVNDCRGLDVPIIEVDKDNPDDVVTEGGHACSLWNCCSLPENPRLRHYNDLRRG